MARFYQLIFIALIPQLSSSNILDEEKQLDDFINFLEGETIKKLKQKLEEKRSKVFENEDVHPDMIFNQSNNGKRSALLKTKFWTANSDGVIKIPYVIKDYDSTSIYNFSPQERLTIEEALSEFNEALSCSHKPWVPRSNEREYIKFQKAQSCQSYVGKHTFDGVQPLFLSEKCIKNKVSIHHEMMHALGFLHEHMRPDRNGYVTINFENIRSGNIDQFDKIPLSFIWDKKSRYDYKSIMHYKKNAFAKHAGLVSIQTNDRRFENVIGQRRGFSLIDVEALNKYFRCQATPSIKRHPLHSEKHVIFSCDFEDGICPSTIRIQQWRRIKDSNCIDTEISCQRYSHLGFCKKKILKEVMWQICPYSCHRCNDGFSLLLEPTYPRFGHIYTMVTRKQMVHYGHCSNNQSQLPLCFRFDLLRSNIYENNGFFESKLEVYSLNFKKVQSLNKTVFYNQVKLFEIPTSRANGEIETIKETIKIKCLDTLFVINASNGIDRLEIDNWSILSGIC